MKIGNAVGKAGIGMALDLSVIIITVIIAVRVIGR